MGATAALFAAGNIINSVINTAFGFLKMERAKQLQLEYEKEKYSAQIAGMQAAGINPAAAFGGAGGWKMGDALPSAGTTRSWSTATNGGMLTTNQLPSYIKPSKPRGPATAFRR